MQNETTFQVSAHRTQKQWRVPTDPPSKQKKDNLPVLLKSDEKKTRDHRRSIKVTLQSNLQKKVKMPKIKQKLGKHLESVQETQPSDFSIQSSLNIVNQTTSFNASRKTLKPV